ncbi:MAG: DNA polymerase III subunit delta' [Nonlabens sp.]
MRYDDAIGLGFIKKHLQTTVHNGRIAHAQLFVGNTGSGVLPLAVAYARNILCGRESTHCDAQIDKLMHPDLHFAFPVASTPTSGSKPTSDVFLKEWREFLAETPYGGLQDWYGKSGIEKKNAEIRVVEAQAIMKKLSLKSYEGGNKVLIVWGADKMNTEAANKLLKLIEEPPSKTIILLLAEDEDRIINTIKSRCQILHIPKLSTTDVASGLVSKLNIQNATAELIARQSNGNFQKAIQLQEQSSEDLEFEKWFIAWVRTAFQAKTKPSAITELLEWANNIASLNRETQKRFLSYCLEFFRQAMLLNYKVPNAVYLQPKNNFELSKFAPFVSGERCVLVSEQINNAIYHIDRNANGKVVLTDLAIGLTRILHSK